MRSAFFACAALAAMTVPAAAQYYEQVPQPGGGYYRPVPPGYGGGYRPRPPYYGGGYDRPGWDYYRPRPRPVQFGNLCITSRGNCGTRPRPVQSPCSCFIPGFGPKRGAVVAGGW